MIRAWNFTKWLFRQFGLFEYSWFLAAFLMGHGIVYGPGDHRTLMFNIAGGIFIFWFAKWTLWDMSKIVWERFEREEGEVFDILKDKNIK